MQDAKIAKNSPSAHHRTTLSSHIFATKAYIHNRKKLLNSNIFSRCPHNIVNFGSLTAEIWWRVWGTPANFNGFRVLAALRHGTLVVASAKLCGVEQRVPPVFGRAAITLGIGPHSSYRYMLYYCGVTWWDWSLSLGPLLPSVLWHCWLGHLTHKNPSLIWLIMCLVGR